MWRILSFGGGNVLVNYPLSALRNQSNGFPKTVLGTSREPNRLVYILQAKSMAFSKQFLVRISQTLRCESDFDVYSIEGRSG